MKEFLNLFVLAGSGSNVLAWCSRPVTDESRFSAANSSNTTLRTERCAPKKDKLINLT